MIDFVVSALLDPLIGSVKSAIEEAAKILWGVEEGLRGLESTLSCLQSVIADAEEKQIESHAVRDWLRKLKEAFSDAQDIMDDFNMEVVLAREKDGTESSKRRKVGSLLTSSFCSKKIISFRHEIGHSIKKIKERLEKIAKERRDFHLVERDGCWSGTEIRQWRPKTGSLIDEDDISGRQDEKSELIDLVLSGQNLFVVSIVGMGGLGKTTLAQLVYNDRAMQEYFAVRGWACVSDQGFDVARIMKEIVESMSGEKCELQGMDALQRRLKNLIEWQRYLLVLDDVWNEDPHSWDALRVPLTCGATGSKIIVTTRSEKVASVMGATLYALEVLPREECLALFTRKVFMGEDLGTHSDLLEIGEKIVDRCEGLPLAVRTVAGILSSIRNKSKWEGVLNNPIWTSPRGDDSILPSLRLSYHHLPPYMKPCFRYLSLFPKDHIFFKPILIKLWAAVGYVLPEGGKDEEEIGNEIFDSLAMRSLLQKEYDVDDDDDDRWYKMHDLVHDLAESISREEFVRMDRSSKSFPIPESARHLSVYQTEINEQRMSWDENRSCKKLRTFLMNQFLFWPRRFPPGFLDSLFQLKYLRVLSLRNCAIKELPNSIGNLKLLQFLDLSDNGELCKLPEAIGCLSKLRTLDLFRCGGLVELPKEIVRLHELQILYIDGTKVSYMPIGIGQLSKLRALRGFVVGEGGIGGAKIVELKDMVNLRGEIRIKCLENVASGEEAKEAEMMNKQHLEQVVFQWSDSRESNGAVINDGEVLEGLQPHSNLKTLEIHGYQGLRLPAWLCDAHLSNLESLDLCNLPNCQLFSLETCTDWSDVNKFPKLRRLILVDLPKLKSFCPGGIQRGQFPCLEYLHINRCQKDLLFEFVPHATTLRSLIIRKFPDLDSLPKDMRNLTSLRELCLGYYPRLASLPDEGLPTCLQTLIIYNCPLLS